MQVDARGFAEFAAKAKAVEPKVRRGINQSLRDIAKPVGVEAIKAGAAGMPHRGGLASRVASRGRVSVTRTATSVRMILGGRKGPWIGRFDEGSLRHPTFGHAPWRDQQIPAAGFSTPIVEAAPQLSDELAAKVGQIMRELG